nr:immunoglobulin heavy chain junction region [Macaca mulatta]
CATIFGLLRVDYW